MLHVVHRSHRGVAAEDRPQRASQFIKLAFELADELFVIAGETIAAFEIARVSGDFSRYEKDEVLPAVHFIPIPLKPFHAHALEVRMGHAFCLSKIPRQFLLVIAIGGPLKLRPHPR